MRNNPPPKNMTHKMPDKTRGAAAFVWSKIWPARPSPVRSRKIAGIRLLIAGMVACLCFTAIGAKALYLAAGYDEASSKAFVKTDGTKRGSIYDRRGRLMASTMPVMTLYVDPEMVLDPQKVADKLAPLLPGKTQRDIANALVRNSRYIALDHKITPRRHAQILDLGLAGVYIQPSYLRTYPHANEAAHILGQVDIDGNGVAGIENSFDQILADGGDVTLSVDLGVQAIVRRSLEIQIEKFEALGGAGLVMDMNTGELVAMVSLPDYDPNYFNLADEDSTFNRASKGVFEMGSIFKVLNTAIALEVGSASLGSSYDVSKPLRVAGFSIRDFHPYNRSLNLSEVLVYSSNIGSAHIADDIGPKVQKSYMEKLGLLRTPLLKLPETARPLIPVNWGRIASMTIAFGHGLSVSPIHAAGAIAAAAGNGEFIEPTILKRKPGEIIERTKIFSPDTARKIRSMMRLVVSHKDGTANFAEVPGYLIGAKTGTAEKINPDGSGYDSNANLTSAVAAFPIHQPKYLVFVMIDEPQPQKFSHNYATAGWVAAPAIAEIVKQAAPVLGVLPIDINKPEIRQNLEPNLNIGGKGVILVSF